MVGCGWCFLSCLDSADECSTTAGGFHVSAKAEPLVAHRVCQVCRYCNDRVATRTMRNAKLGSNARSVAVQVPASLDPTVPNLACTNANVVRTRSHLSNVG